MAAELRWTVVVLMLVGCDGDPPPGGGATTTGGGTSTEPTTSAGPGSTTDIGMGGDSSSGSAVDCEAMDHDPTACAAAEGCMAVDSHFTHATDTCSVDGLGWNRCVTKGEPLPAGYRSSYYRELEGALFWIVANQGCDSALPAVPEGWTECSGAPGEPEPCQCLCVADVCPWEQEPATLEACGVAQPCGDSVTQGLGDPFEAYSQCVLQAMRDRTPGFHDWWVEDIPFLLEDRIYSAGGEQVQVVSRGWSDICGGVGQGSWRGVESCTLQPPAFFDDCLTSPMPQAECYMKIGWFTDCVPVEPTCP